MGPETSLTADIIARAESHEGVRAGMARLADILDGPSYRVRQARVGRPTSAGEDLAVEWAAGADTVLVLGLHHPESDPNLDWWEFGNTRGNRRLREISALLEQWLRERHGIEAQPLPYQAEKGGVFLKDAAVLSGMGIVGRNNLLVHPEWGPRIRLRSMLLAGSLPATLALGDFSPCRSCEGYCQKACPVNAFPRRKYHRGRCVGQLAADEADRGPDLGFLPTGGPNPLVRYCRACELACPVGR